MTTKARINLEFIQETLELLDKLYRGESIELRGMHTLIVKSNMTHAEYAEIKAKLNEEAATIINASLKK